MSGQIKVSFWILDSIESTTGGLSYSYIAAPSIVAENILSINSGLQLDPECDFLEYQ